MGFRKLLRRLLSCDSQKTSLESQLRPLPASYQSIQTNAPKCALPANMKQTAGKNLPAVQYITPRGERKPAISPEVKRHMQKLDLAQARRELDLELQKEMTAQATAEWAAGLRATKKSLEGLPESCQRLSRVVELNRIRQRTNAVRDTAIRAEFEADGLDYDKMMRKLSMVKEQAEPASMRLKKTRRAASRTISQVFDKTEAIKGRVSNHL